MFYCSNFMYAVFAYSDMLMQTFIAILEGCCPTQVLEGHTYNPF